MKAFFVLTALLYSLTGIAQTNLVKLYGYAQPVIGGVPSTFQTDEQGNSIEPDKKAHTNHLLYLTYPKNQVIYPIQIWVKGEVYSIKVQPAQTPVVALYDNGAFDPQQVILVPQTEDTCLQIVLTGDLPVKNTAVKKSLIESNDLVLAYGMKGRVFSQTLKK